LRAVAEPSREGQVYTGVSQIHGTGLFAARDFESGEVIFVRDESRVVDDSDVPNGVLPEEVCAWLDDGRTVLIGEPARYHNHSCDPNTYIRHVGLAGEVVALRGIRGGEELTTDYQMSGRGNSSWPCSCGSSTCRGTVGPNFWTLPLELQVKYLPLLSPQLRERSEDRIAAISRAAGTA
jgi:hypothetical protein